MSRVSFILKIMNDAHGNDCMLGNDVSLKKTNLVTGLTTPLAAASSPTLEWVALSPLSD